MTGFEFWWWVSGDSEEARSDDDCEDLWGGLFWHSWCSTNQIKSFQVLLPWTTNASDLIVTTSQDFDDRGDVLFGEGEVIPCVSIEERLPTFKKMSKQSASSFFKTIADVYCLTSSSRHLNFVFLQGLSGRWRRGMVRDVLWKGYRSISLYIL